MNYLKENGVYDFARMNQNYEISYTKVNEGNKANNVYSVAKLFTSLALGICYDHKLIKLDDKLLDILEINFQNEYEEKWKNVTIEMLLTHKIGLSQGLLDIDIDDTSKYNTNNYLEYVLKTPLEKEQGVYYQYSDASYYLLSLIIEKVTSETLYNFLAPILMQTLEFKEYAWTMCPLYHTIGATGLYLRVDDLVKVGMIYANDGFYKKTKIISKEWIQLSINNSYSLIEYKDGWYYKDGMYGQYLAFNINTKESFACLSHSNTLDLEKLLNS